MGNEIRQNNDSIISLEKTSDTLKNQNITEIETPISGLNDIEKDKSKTKYESRKTRRKLKTEVEVDKIKNKTKNESRKTRSIFRAKKNPFIIRKRIKLEEIKNPFKKREKVFLRILKYNDIYDQNLSEVTDINIIFENQTDRITILSELEEIEDKDKDIKELIISLQNYEKINNEILTYKYDEDQKKEVKEKQSTENIINTINNIDSKNISSKEYFIKNIPEQNGNNTTIYISGQKFDGLTGKEYNSLIEKDNKGNNIIKNPEALKNLVDFKEKMELLNLGFVWKFRNQLISTFRNTDGYEGYEMDINDDYINRKELNNLLNFILKVAGFKGNVNGISGTYAKIIEINGAGALNNKKNTNTKLSPIGQIFLENKFINLGTSLSTENLMNLRNSEKWLEKKS